MLCNCLSVCLLQLILLYWPTGFSHSAFLSQVVKQARAGRGLCVAKKTNTPICLHACHFWKTKTVSHICFCDRRSQRRCFLTTTFSSTWRATRQSTTCAVRSSRSTTPPKNSEGSWSKLEGWGFPLHCGWTKKDTQHKWFWLRRLSRGWPSRLSWPAIPCPVWNPNNSASSGGAQCLCLDLRPLQKLPREIKDADSGWKWVKSGKFELLADINRQSPVCKTKQTGQRADFYYEAINTKEAANSKTHSTGRASRLFLISPFISFIDSFYVIVLQVYLLSNLSFYKCFAILAESQVIFPFYVHSFSQRFFWMCICDSTRDVND